MNYFVGDCLVVAVFLSILGEIAGSRSFDAEERRLHALSDLGLTDYSRTRLPQTGDDGEAKDLSKSAAFMAPYFRSFLAGDSHKERGETDGEVSIVPTGQLLEAFNADWLNLLDIEISGSTGLSTTSFDLKPPDQLEITSNAACIMSTSQSTGLNPTNGSSNNDSGTVSQASPQLNERVLEESTGQRPSHTTRPTLALQLSYKEVLQKKVLEKYFQE